MAAERRVALEIALEGVNVRPQRSDPVAFKGLGNEPLLLAAHVGR